jgi:hypothetical protein
MKFFVNTGYRRYRDTMIPKIPDVQNSVSLQIIMVVYFPIIISKLKGPHHCEPFALITNLTITTTNNQLMKNLCMKKLTLLVLMVQR